MSYLLDKKQKIKKIKRVALFAVFFLFLIYFRSGVMSGLSATAHFVFRPFVFLGNNIGNNFKNLGVYFDSKKRLSLENETLKLNQNLNEARMSNYNSILDENTKLKDALGRSGENKNLILGNILSKPNSSPYDTFIIDIGTKNGIAVGQKVFAQGNVPIGKIGEVYINSSKVVLYSSPLEKTEVVVSGRDAYMQVIGRGGGNFEMLLPRDFLIEKGAEVFLPGIMPLTVAKVETILSDPRDSYQKALLLSPINIFQLKSVEVEK